MVRFKSAQPTEQSLGRPHATEEPHSDSWAGESSESVTVYIPLLGDAAGNFFQMYYPKHHFEEAFLGARKDYRDGHDVLWAYEKVDYICPLGNVLLVDFATLHATTRLPLCGPRVSIDTTFTLKKRDMQEKIHPWREGERMNCAQLRGVGTECLLYFPTPPDEKVDGPLFKHPTDPQVIEL